MGEHSIEASTSLNTSYYETPLNSPINHSFIENGSVSDQCSDLSSLWQTIDNSIQTDQEFTVNRPSSPCDSVKTLIQDGKTYCKSNKTEFDTKIFLPLENTLNFSSNHFQLIKKFNNVIKHLKFIQEECSKTQIYERQLMDLCQQLRQYRENLVQKNSLTIKLLNELVHILNEDFKNLDITSFYSNEGRHCHPVTLKERIMNYQKDRLIQNSSKIDEELKYKLRRLPAMVKGYLIRRLMATEKISSLKRTIRDTSAILLNFKQQLIIDGKLIVTHEDVLFHKRLCIQLEKSCKEFYSIFFSIPIYKQMELISKHREYVRNVMFLKEKKLRSNSVMSQMTMDSSQSSSSTAIMTTNRIRKF